MKRLLWRLDYLCIETLSKNICRYKIISKENWKLRNCNDLGDQLILASITNSLPNGIDEKSYEFILNNFLVKNLKIYSKMIEKIKYLDFLNERSFDKLEIILQQKLRLKNKKQNFRLTTNNLILKEPEKSNFFIKSFRFFSNICVKKNLEIRLFNKNSKHDKNSEKLLLIILQNTSKDVENIQIFFQNPTKKFLEKFMVILRERKNLKNLNVFLDGKETKAVPIFFLETSLIPRFYIDLKSLKSDMNLSEYFKIFSSVENLEIIFFGGNILIEKLNGNFYFLKSLNLNNLHKLYMHFKLPNLMPTNLVNDFLKNCPNLVILDTNHSVDFKSILPCSNSLKTLNITLMKIDDETTVDDLKYFFSTVNLNEIKLRLDNLTEKELFKIIESLDKLKNILTSLTISCYRISANFINFLPNFKKLKCFYLKFIYMENNILSGIFKNLQSSNQCLEKIYIYHQNNPSVLENSNELFHLLNKCDNLKTIYITIKIDENKITDLLFLLKKFNNSLEEINIDFCCHEKFYRELMDFLSGCLKLKYVTGDDLPRDIFWEKEFFKSLFNSRYSLQYAKCCYENNLDRFPNILMDHPFKISLAPFFLFV